MAIEKNIKINVDTTQAKSSVKSLGKEVEKTSEKTEDSVNQMGGTLDKVTGGAITKLKGVTGGLKSVALGFKSVGSAIALSGIGLLVITIAALGAAFKGNEEGQNKFAKILGVIGAVTGNLVDLLADLGEAIITTFENPKQAIKDFSNLIKTNITNRFDGLMELIPALGEAINLLFRGEFSEAGKVAGNAVGKVALGVENLSSKIDGATESLKGFVNQNIEEGKAAAKVADQRAKADIIERNLIVEKAKAEREIADLRLIAKDLNNVSAKEREQALLKVLEIQDGLITKETEVLTLRRDAQIAENGFARSNKENLLAEEEAKAKVIAAETRRTDQKRAIQRELTATENELRSQRDSEEKDRQAKIDAADKVEKERLKSISDFKEALIEKDRDLDAVTEEQKLELERTRAEEKLATLIGNEEEKREALLALNEFYDQKEDELEVQRAEEKKIQDQKDLDDAKIKADKEAKIAKDKADAEVEYREGVKDASLQLASSTLGALGALAKEGSAVAKGVAVAQAIMNTYQGVTKALAETTDPTPSQTLRFGNAIAVGVAGLANVAKILSTKPVESTAPSLAGGGSRPSAPSFNLVQGSATNQIAQSVQTGTQPTRAFVVSSDVTSQQSLDRRIEQGSTL